jgi:hypothetical protein
MAQSAEDCSRWLAPPSLALTFNTSGGPTVFQLDVHNPKAPALTCPVDDLKHERR